MEILSINKYLYLKGGGATSALSMGGLLSRSGHKVIFWGMEYPLNPPYPHADIFISNIDFGSPGNIWKQLKIGSNLLYSFEANKKVKILIKTEKPDIVYLNNFAHQISPSIPHVFRKHNIPIVMTMHDYKLVCASYTLLAKGKICEACKGRMHYRCFLKSCVKDSHVRSLLNTVEMYLHHKILHIYKLVNIFISPSQFLKEKVEEMGFKGKIVYLPNFIKIEDYYPRYD